MKTSLPRVPNPEPGASRGVGINAHWWQAGLLGGLFLWASGCGPAPELGPPPGTLLHLSPQDRLLILAPHPDDEMLGCGGILQEAVARRLPVRIVFFTYGDNNQWSFLVYRKHPVLAPNAVRRMGLVRHDEALAAAQLLGLSSEELTFLGYPDFGTLHIWKAHWGDRPPFRSMLTRVTAVPYPNAWRPGAAYTGEEVLRDLTDVLREFRPTKVFVSHPSDHMPDHAALYLFTRVALWDLDRELHPALYPYLIHFRHWPAPRGNRSRQALEPPALLRDSIPWQVYPLSPAAVERKRAALQAHRTQYRVSGAYLLSFVRANELFGDFPVVPLRATLAPTPLSTEGPERLAESPEELTEKERAAFVGIEWRFVQLVGDELILSIEFSRPLAEAVQASVYIFGYRSDRPFGEMPKLHVELGALTQKADDQDRALPEETVRVERQPRQITLRVPLRVLGWPRRILTSARTSLADVPLDWASWRVLDLAPPE